jgi:hypothetical protein
MEDGLILKALMARAEATCSSSSRPGPSQYLRARTTVCLLLLTCSDGADGERPITIEWRLRYAMPREVLVAERVAG